MHGNCILVPCSFVCVSVCIWQAGWRSIIPFVISPLQRITHYVLDVISFFSHRSYSWKLYQVHSFHSQKYDQIRLFAEKKVSWWSYMSCPVILQELKLTFKEIWNKIYIAFFGSYVCTNAIKYLFKFKWLSWGWDSQHCWSLFHPTVFLWWLQMSMKYCYFSHCIKLAISLWLKANTEHWEEMT